MKYIDLHVHSNLSDGTVSPAGLVQKAQHIGLAAIALTDHDTLAGIPEAVAEAKQLSKTGNLLEIIPGIEISAAYVRRDIHILGLFVSEQSEELQRALKKAKEERNDRNIIMANRLQKGGFDITTEELRQMDPNSVITRAHFAKLMVKKGYAKDNKEVFSKYLGEESPYYVPRKYILPEEAIRLIKLAGGIPILAHPLLYHLPPKELDALIALLKERGLAGLEVMHSSNTGFDEGILRGLAHKYDLQMSGGSDYHGTNKPLIQLGTGKGNLKIPYSILEELKAYKCN